MWIPLICSTPVSHSIAFGSSFCAADVTLSGTHVEQIKHSNPRCVIIVTSDVTWHIPNWTWRFSLGFVHNENEQKHWRAHSNLTLYRFSGGHIGHIRWFAISCNAASVYSHRSCIYAGLCNNIGAELWLCETMFRRDSRATRRFSGEFNSEVYFFYVFCYSYSLRSYSKRPSVRWLDNKASLAVAKAKLE